MSSVPTPADGRPRVLVVEDEPVINQAVTDRLRGSGYDVVQAWDGPGGVARCAETEPDLVVLDVMLPGFDGHEVCRRIQAARPVPVLMLTARDDEADILVGLGVGADDYMTKPFRMRELVARVAALLRRVERAAELAATRAAGPLDLGDLRVDGAARRVFVDGAEVHLTPTEFDLLVCLAGAPGTVLTREHLYAEVWGWPGASGTRTVDSHVKALRAKIGSQRVRTVHGVGYALETAPSEGQP
jgi:DNA-binding response OmpR family regulator